MILCVCARVRGLSISFESEIVKLREMLSQMESVFFFVVMVNCFQFTSCEKKCYSLKLCHQSTCY